MTDLYKHGQRIIIAPHEPVPFTTSSRIDATAQNGIDISRVALYTDNSVALRDFLCDVWPEQNDHVKRTLDSTQHALVVEVNANADTHITIREPGSSVLFIRAQQGVTATITIEQAHEGHAAQLVRIIAHERARVTIMHRANVLTHYVSYRQALQHAHSTINWSGIPIVTDYARIEHHNTLCGAHAHAHQHTRLHAHGNAHYDIALSSTHNAPETKSTLDGRAVASDNSKVLLRGSLSMDPASAMSTGRQSLHILTTDTAEGDAIPHLDIAQHDVTCQHRASVRGILPDDRFSLEQRGIAPDSAQEILVSGFLEVHS